MRAHAISCSFLAIIAFLLGAECPAALEEVERVFGIFVKQANCIVTEMRVQLLAIDYSAQAHALDLIAKQKSRIIQEVVANEERVIVREALLHRAHHAKYLDLA